jgi:uncharacterized protein (TIGR00730 family)
MAKQRRRQPVKAYKNEQFLNSPDARILRIMAEFVEPLRRFKHQAVSDTIVFFGSARAIPLAEAEAKLDKARRNAKAKRGGKRRQKLAAAQAAVELARYYEQAEELAFLLTRWSKSLAGGKRFLVCSGGGPGIMEAANRGASRARGRSIGLNISLPMEQYSNPYISDSLNFEFHYFFMRKFWFAYMAKAMIFFPGGFGTMDELMEVLTLVQTQKVTKPMPLVLYGTEYWREVIDFERLAKCGTISPEDIKLMRRCDTPGEAFEYLRDELTRLHLKRGVEEVKPRISLKADE